MENPKMMMGLVALLLAGAGAFASISQPQQTRYYYEDESQETGCTEIQLTTTCSESGIGCEDTTPDGLRQLYSDPDCQQSLKQDAGF